MGRRKLPAGNGSSNSTRNSTNETNILAGIFALHSRRNCFFPSSTMQTKRSFSLAQLADTLHYLLMYGTHHQLLHTPFHISSPAAIPIGIRSDATRGYCNCGHNLSKLSDDIYNMHCDRRETARLERGALLCSG